MEKKTVKKKTKRQIVFDLMLMFSLVVLIVAVAYSWFIKNNASRISGSTVTIESKSSLTISDRNDESALWLSTFIALDKKDSFPLQAVCGNGSDFFFPVFGRAEEASFSNEKEDVFKTDVTGYKRAENTEALFNDSIYKLDFFFNIGDDSDLYLGPKSSITPDLLNSPKSQINSNLSTGYISGAVRMMLFQKKGENFIPVLYWIPDTTTEYNAKSKTVNENGTVESEYKVVLGEEKNGDQFVINTDVNGDGVSEKSGMKKANGIYYCWGDIPNDLPAIAKLKQGADNPFRLVIWVEGTDRECDNALLGGRFNIDLKFDAKAESN